MTVEETIAHVRAVAVEKIGPNLGPEDDWIPVAFVFYGDRADILGLQFSNQQEKEVAYRAVARVIWQRRARMVAVVNTVWMALSAGVPYDLVPPSQREDRIEALYVSAFDADGNSASWLGLIERGEGPPTVREQDDGSQLTFPVGAVGAIPDVLKSALADVRKAGA